jgi:uncharacterized protein YbjT (DUF2867 family)
MNKVLIIGGSGVLGSAVVNELQNQRVDFLIGSRKPLKTDSYSTVNQVTGLPWTRVDLLSGEGLTQALDGIDTVFHLASMPGNTGGESSEAVMTRNLLKAVKQSDVKHLIYSSIVGIDKIKYSYYQAKLDGENLIRQSQIPYTILRATQFHDLVDFGLSKLLSLPIGFLPKKLLVQPIHVDAVAQKLLELAKADSQQTVINLGGPYVYDAGTLARLWMKHRHIAKLIVPVPAIGAMMKSIAKGYLTCPESVVNSQTWEEYLAKKYS